MKSLNKLAAYLKKEIEPIAHLIDQDTELLRTKLRAIEKVYSLSPHLPKEYHGLGSDPKEVYEYQALLAQYSSAIAFTQVQHHRAVSTLIGCENNVLKQKLLPKIGHGQYLIGVGRSALRAIDNPLLMGVKQNNNYTLNGFIPYASGYTLFDYLIIGFVLADKREVNAVIPFKEINESQGQIIINSPYKLMVVQSTNTVSIKLVNYQLAQENIINSQPTGASYRRNLKDASLSAYPIGTARAALELVANSYKLKQSETLLNFYLKLKSQIESYMLSLMDPNRNISNTELRANIITTAQKACYFALILAGGRGMLINHPAQRLYREIAQWSIGGVNLPIIEKQIELMNNTTMLCN